MTDYLPVEILDEDNPENNMYGCAPCPRCGRRYRYPLDEVVMICDDCGYRCRWVRKEGGMP